MIIAGDDHGGADECYLYVRVHVFCSMLLHCAQGCVMLSIICMQLCAVHDIMDGWFPLSSIIISYIVVCSLGIYNVRLLLCVF